MYKTILNKLELVSKSTFEVKPSVDKTTGDVVMIQAKDIDGSIIKDNAGNPVLIKKPFKILIKDAVIIFCNMSGLDEYGSGARSFQVIVPDELGIYLMNAGVAVRYHQEFDEAGNEIAHAYTIKITSKYRNMKGEETTLAPHITIASTTQDGNHVEATLSEDTVSQMDDIQIAENIIEFSYHDIEVRKKVRHPLYLRNMWFVDGGAKPQKANAAFEEVRQQWLSNVTGE